MFPTVCDRFEFLTRPSQFDVLLQPKVEFERALRQIQDKDGDLAVDAELTLIFRKAVLFSLHHVSASVQLYFERASSIRCMSVNKSISTSVCQ